MKFDLYQAVADLRASWANLPDVDRAEAIIPILNHKMSGRTLAAALHCSESLLRYLKPLVRATGAEMKQSRAGLISTRKLRRIILDREAQKRSDRDELQVAKQAKAAEKGANDILSFFKTQRILVCYAEPIWTQTLGRLRGLEETGFFRDRQRPKGMSTADIISRCWPVFAPNGDTTIAYVNCCADWMVRWTSYAMPNSAVRELAFRLAWAKLVKGYRLVA